MEAPTNYSEDIIEAKFPANQSLLFAYHDAHPLALASALLSKFGLEWLDWEAVTLRHEISREFQASSVSPANWEKVQAMRALMMAVSYWSEWHVFEKITQALNNRTPQFSTVQAATIPQLAFSVHVASNIPERDIQFSDEVARYVAACALEEGVTYLPPPLSFAQVVLATPTYYCKDCGSVDDDDLEDGRCDFCVGRYRGTHPLDRKPAEGVPSHVGGNIVRFVKRDPSGAKKRYDELLLKGADKVRLSEDSPEDVQAGKLYVAHEYLRLRDAQLSAQMRGIRQWNL